MSLVDIVKGIKREVPKDIHVVEVMSFEPWSASIPSSLTVCEDSLSPKDMKNAVEREGTARRVTVL